MDRRDIEFKSKFQRNPLIQLVDIIVFKATKPIFGNYPMQNEHDRDFLYCRQFLCLACFALAATPSTYGDILAGPIMNPENGHAYYLLTNATWTDSEAEAISMGGHLVTINNAAENQWVFDTFAGFGGEDRMLWIGFNDLQQQGVYEWSSGEQATYTNWETGQPSDVNERWVLMYPDNVTPDSFPRLPGTWNDFRDSDIEHISGDVYFLYGVVEVAEPLVFELMAESFLVTRGIHVAGGVFELGVSDNIDLSIQRATSDIQSTTELEVKAVCPVANPSSIDVKLEGAVFARSQVNQTIELFNYVDGTWEEVDTRTATRFTDSTVIVAATGDLSRFVEAGTMCIEARIRYQSPVARQQFSSNTDQFIWTIGQ
jgi:hypothetical protein